MRTVLVCVKTPESAQRITASAIRMGLAQAVRTVLTTDEVHMRMATTPADVVLVDVGLARPDPVQFTRTVLARAPRAGVVLVGAVDPRVAAMTVAAGARGVVRGGGEEGEDLVVALTQAIMLICPRAAGLNGGQRRVPTQRGGPVGLTEREMQVLRGMSEGKSNAEIGRDLFVSEDTIKTHARRLFRKLGARDRAHAVAEGFRGGIVT
ncbi:helix-turn-helix transcriptional regulator [Stackebrandtia nassauensis]|uniref:Transcriptional regulator, LuxR family n=1 Tax=Stackebrandtia nassauensis (strain DSM 44728 / CIP 108903 / NRRL B-16338 / NBRC 102104 / LLR-40K-21) TaxID=446470 RepID=D3QA86_STANL|nr:response regulator transcription factor [Stackebrandtia nassauensis]ADD40798.1 transcriptional regulator, LuxR family [Stackebrandtia nassauensis DSM 44728]